MKSMPTDGIEQAHENTMCDIDSALTHWAIQDLHFVNIDRYDK